MIGRWGAKGSDTSVGNAHEEVVAAQSDIAKRMRESLFVCDIVREGHLADKLRNLLGSRGMAAEKAHQVASSVLW